MMSENVQFGSSSGLDFNRASNSAKARDLAQAKKLVKLISVSFILATMVEFILLFDSQCSPDLCQAVNLS